METIKAIIVENEQHNSDFLQELLKEYYKGIAVVATCTTTKDSVAKIQELQPQLVFLDIRLERKESGFEILELTRQIPYDVIFTTGYDEYAIKAFKFSAIDYLLKPFGLDELKSAMDKYFSKAIGITAKSREALLYNYGQTNKAMHKVGISTAGGINFITVADIICCTASGNYTEIHLTGGKKLITSKNLGTIEDLLSGHIFFRVHHSSLVSLNHLKKFETKTDTLILSDNTNINVAKRRKEEFLKTLAYLKIVLAE